MVKTLLDAESESRGDTTVDKLASLLGADSADEQNVDAEAALKTASLLEKLGRAIDSGQAKLDNELRRIFAGDSDDETIKRHNEIEDAYLEQTWQSGV